MVASGTRVLESVELSVGTLQETLSETGAGAYEIDGETVLVSRVKGSICMKSDLVRL